MPDRKISQLPASTGFAADDLVPFVDTSESVTRRATLPEFGRAVGPANVFYPRNFGAAGDGVVDDVDALLAAAAAASSFDGIGVVYGEGRTYGVGNSSLSSAYLLNGLTGVLFIDIDLFLLDGADSHVWDLRDLTDVTFERCSANGNSANQTLNVHGFRGQDLTRVKLIDCPALFCPGYGYGLQAGVMIDVDIIRPYVADSGRDGIDIKNMEDANWNLRIFSPTIERFGADNAGDYAGVDVRGPGTVVHDPRVFEFSHRTGGTSITGVRFRHGEAGGVNGVGAHYSTLIGGLVDAGPRVELDFPVIGYNLISRNGLAVAPTARHCWRGLQVGQSGWTVTDFEAIDCSDEGGRLADQVIVGEVVSEGDLTKITMRVIADEVTHGVMRAGATVTTLPLAADSPWDDDEILGWQVWIRPGSSDGNVRQILGYDSATQTATVATLSGAPAEGTDYTVACVPAVAALNVQTDNNDIDLNVVGVLDPDDGTTPIPGTVGLVLQSGASANRYDVTAVGYAIGTNNLGTGNVSTGASVGQVTTQAGNTTTGEDDLMAWAIPPARLNSTGAMLRFWAAGTLTNNVNQKRLRVKLGATTILDTGATGLSVSSATNWVIRGEIIRTSATTQKCIVEIATSDAVFKGTATYTETAEDLTTALVLKLTGEGVATDDIVQELLTVEVAG